MAYDVKDPDPGIQQWGQILRKLNEKIAWAGRIERITKIEWIELLSGSTGLGGSGGSS